MAAIHDALTAEGGVAGAALRRGIGLRSTRQADLALLRAREDARRSSASRDRPQIRSLLEGLVAPGLPDYVAKAAAVTGDSVTSLPVAARVAGLCAFDELETQALLRAAAASLPADWAEWSAYRIWNEVIARHFFSGRHAGRPVYLDLEEDLLEDLAQQIASDAGLVPLDPVRAFSRSVAQTFELRPNHAPMLEKHVRAARRWAASLPAQHSAAAPSDGSHPPFVAALGLFVLAAEQMRSSGEMRSTNYYGRLTDLLEVGADDGASRVQEHFRRHGRVLWDYLNQWLSAFGGTLGFATAQAFDGRVHVGLPISQALVREAERSQLPELFAKYELRPGQQFSKPDMREILGSWLPSSSLTNLKAAWKAGQEAQSQIADVVCSELEHWDGTVLESSAGSGVEVQARLAATYYEIPIPEFLLSLVLREGDAAPLGEYRDRTNGGVVTATRDMGGLARLAAGTAASAEDGLALSALRRPVELTHVSGKTLIARPARPVVVLQFDESLMLFLETARVELGGAHLILVRDHHTQEVSQALSQIARPGYRAVRGTSEIPSGWTLFTDVSIQGLLNNPPDFLRPLVPLSRVQVEFTGGLRITGGRWHASFPPTVVAVEGTGRQFAVRLLSEFTVTGDAVNKDLGVHSREARIPLGNAELPDGNYRVLLNTVTEGGAAGGRLTSRVLKLRSGASARLDPPPQVQLQHTAAPTLDEWSALSAGAGSVGEALAIRGAVFEATSQVPVPKPDEALPRRLGIIPPPASLESLFRRLPNSSHDQLRAAFDDLVSRGQVILTSEGPRLTPKGRQSADRDGNHLRNRPPGASPAGSGTLPEGSTADLDSVFDAMVVSGWGTWASLRELVSETATERWEPLEAVRNLRSLGHIDVELEGRTLRPRSWSVAPSAIVVQPDGRSAYVAGWRTEELLSNIEREAKALGGVPFRHSRPGRPLLLQVHALSAERFEELASRLLKNGPRT